MENLEEKNNLIIEELNTLKNYFKFNLSSLHKLSSDFEKYKKFREKWINYLNVNLNENHLEEERDKVEKNKSKNPFVKRNTLNNPNSRLKINENFFKLKENSINNSGNVNSVFNKNKENLLISNSKIKETKFSNNSIKISEKSEKSEKTFLIIGGYPDIKKSLIDRGWKKLEDSTTLDFDFKWALLTKDTPQANTITRDQIVNHYINNIEITKKSGLAKNLKNMIFRQINVDNFYPRSYELSERNEFEDFLEEFKANKAANILKQIILKKRKDISENMIRIAIIICERRMKWFDILENYPNQDEISSNLNEDLIKNFKIQNLISDLEWCIISEEDNTNYAKEIEKLEKMNKIGYQRKSTINIKKESVKNINTKINFNNENNNINDNYLLEKYENSITNLLAKMEKFYPQFQMNGDNNIWILKPCGLSRGRGICCMNNLNDIFNLIKRNSSQYIAQKYIENPLIILGRKFDIRQWVLVTDLDPLTIWMYETPYVRFGAEDYKLEEFDNLYSHLTNNSVIKYSKNFINEKIEGNMWDINQFSDYLKSLFGRDVWKEEIQDKIRKIIITSLESARRNFKYRKNSHELFGYDIMIDDSLNVWLIEVNSSPAMDYSTPITEKLVKQMSEDLVKVVVDYKLSDDINKDRISTGMFIKIYECEHFDQSYCPN